MLMKVYLWFRKNILKIDDRSQLEIAIENGLKIGKNHLIGVIAGSLRLEIMLQLHQEFIFYVMMQVLKIH